MWVIAVLGIASGAGGLAQAGLTYGAFGVCALLLLLGLLAVAALFGVGPLRERGVPTVETHQEAQNPRTADGDSTADQLVRIVRLRDSGEISQKQFDAAKSRILDV